MKRTILTADDSPSIREYVGEALRLAGFDVLEAADGCEALAKLGSERVHLLITDLNMPGYDGIELTRRVRALPHCRFMPILVLTTERSAEKMAEGRAAGASGWITKPFSPDRLVHLVRRIVS